MCVHVTVTADGLSGWQTPVMLQPLHPEIKYDSRDLTARISLVFVEYHGSLFMFVAKTTASFVRLTKRQQQRQCCYLPQLIQIFQNLLLVGDDGPQLLLPGSIQLEAKYNMMV